MKLKNNLMLQLRHPNNTSPDLMSNFSNNSNFCQLAAQNDGEVMEQLASTVFINFERPLCEVKKKKNINTHTYTHKDNEVLSWQ